MLRLDTPTARLRTVAFVEGWSYLLLVFLAVPVKYLLDNPMAVRVLGPIHGGLFIWLAYAAFEVRGLRGKPISWFLWIGVASLIPFGTFFWDKAFAREDEAYRREHGAASE
ncbi:UNVERIFIED_CONTAM: hypothetical protein GTU68_003886 [Idotea baltica]|nr:hypothetical protein [Idotea baltica]